MLMLVFWYCLPDALIKVSYKQNFMSYVTTSSSLKCTYMYVSVSRSCGLTVLVQSTPALIGPFVTEFFNDICLPGLTILQGSGNGMVHCEVGD